MYVIAGQGCAVGKRYGQTYTPGCDGCHGLETHEMLPTECPDSGIGMQNATQMEMCVIFQGFIAVEHAYHIMHFVNWPQAKIIFFCRLDIRAQIRIARYCVCM
jgi:hypothetical protein